MSRLVANLSSKMGIMKKDNSETGYLGRSGSAAWAPTTAMPMWPPPGHSGWTPDPEFGGPGRVWVVNPMQIMRLRNKTKSSLVKFIEFSKTFTEKWFSHILLIMVLISYAALGAWMFMVIEGQVETRSKAPVVNIKDRIKREMLYYTQNQSLPRQQLERIIEHRLHEFEKQVYQNLKSGPPIDSETGTIWTFWTSFVYCFTVFTTIGYGHIAPVTTMGRAVTMAYACVGIPLLLMVLTDLGKLFTRMIKYVFGWLRRMFMAKKLQKMRQAGRKATLVPQAAHQYMAHKLENAHGLKNALRLKSESDVSRISCENNDNDKSVSESNLNPPEQHPGVTCPRRKRRSKSREVKIPHENNSDTNNNKNDKNGTEHKVTIEDIPMVQVTSPTTPFIYSTPMPGGHPLLITPGIGPTGASVVGGVDGQPLVMAADGTTTGPGYLVDDEFNLPVSLALLILVLYMMMGALVFTYTDGWTFFDSFYFVFISISTIGFGDLTPDSDLSMIAASIYLLFGLALTSMCINVIQEQLATAFEEAKLRLGTRIGFDINSIEPPQEVTNEVDDKKKKKPDNEEMEKLRRKARAESEDRRKRREEKKKLREENGEPKESRNKKKKKSPESIEAKDNPVTFVEAKQSAPLITFKLQEGEDLAKKFKEKREKKRIGDETSPVTSDGDSMPILVVESGGASCGSAEANKVDKSEE